MSKLTREKEKSRSESGSFLLIPHKCLRHKNFISLSPRAVKLLVDLLLDYRGFNNGDLCISWVLMKKRGWKSPITLNLARLELLHYGWIICSRQGGRNLASLYAVTFKPIDDCKGKIYLKETVTALGCWKDPKPPFTIKKKKISKKNMKNKTESLVQKLYQLDTETVLVEDEKPYLIM